MALKILSDLIDLTSKHANHYHDKLVMQVLTQDIYYILATYLKV